MLQDPRGGIKYPWPFWSSKKKARFRFSTTNGGRILATRAPGTRKAKNPKPTLWESTTSVRSPPALTLSCHMKEVCAATDSRSQSIVFRFTCRKLCLKAGCLRVCLHSDVINLSQITLMLVLLAG